MVRRYVKLKKEALHFHARQETSFSTLIELPTSSRHLIVGVLIDYARKKTPVMRNKDLMSGSTMSLLIDEKSWNEIAAPALRRMWTPALT